MKKILTLALLLFALLNAFGQDRDTVSIDLEDKFKLYIVPLGPMDWTYLRQYDFNAMMEDLAQSADTSLSQAQALSLVDSAGQRYRRDSATAQRQPEGVPFNQPNDSTCRPWKNKEYWKKWDLDDKENDAGSFFSLDLGMNNYLSGGQFPESAPYAVRPWGSWSVGLNSEFNTRLAGPLHLHWGAGVSWYNFKFQDRGLQLKDSSTGVVFYQADQALNAHKSKLTVTYLNLRVVPMLEFGGPKKKGVFGGNSKSSTFRIGAGGYAGYRLDSYTKFVHLVDGDKIKSHDHNDFSLNGLRYGLRFRLGYGDVDFFMDYDLNPLFSDNRGPDLNAISFGIVL
ncbi:MAG: hypothetical protein HC842_03840 [Cytophagales bacterium]|nr:hypothetical protein [Cytophagales bacterium]